MKRSHRSRLRAFTLIELMTVVAIIAMLSALGFWALKYAMNKSREKDTVATISKISTAIQSYRDDRGNYPRPAMDEETTTVDEETWKVGGAKMLYQVLSGDGDDAVKGGEKRSNGTQGSAKDEKDEYAGRIYLDTIVAPTQKEIEEKKKGKPVASDGSGSYYVVDPWQHPLQYQVAERDKNGVITNEIEMHAGDNAYELWSYGTLRKAGETDEDKKKWITNWSGQQ